MIKKKLIKILLIAILLVIILIPTGVFVINKMVENANKENIYSNVDKIPKNKVGLVLGTSKYITNGTINHYYTNRINAVYELFNANKIEFVLISGDNGNIEYNEPETMKSDLVEMGIPPEKIYLDYAGFRTLDSVIRCKKIFGQNSFTIISQQFHNERALYIAKSNNINAIAYNAKDVSYNYGKKIQQREKLARVKMIIDLLLSKNPKFLGEKIEIK